MSFPNNHLFPPGPCEIAVQTGVSGDTFTYEFLGTTREGGQAQEVIYTSNFFTDYAGSAGMPADVSLGGKGIVVACQISNFNPFVMSRLKSRYYGGVDGYNTKGVIDVNDMGALLIAEERYTAICIRSLNANGDTPRYPDNEAGIWVPFCFPSGEMGWDYANREQVYNLMLMGLTYMNLDEPDGVSVGDLFFLPYNGGLLYSTNISYIAEIWASVTNPTS